MRALHPASLLLALSLFATGSMAERLRQRLKSGAYDPLDTAPPWRRV